MAGTLATLLFLLQASSQSLSVARMATFHATLLAVSPCTLCSATETVPGSFISVFDGVSLTTYTGTPLTEQLVSVLGCQPVPEDTGTMLCPHCLHQLDRLDLLQSQRQLLQDELTQLYQAPVKTEALHGSGLRDNNPSTCLACHAILSLHNNTNAFWEKTQFSSTTLADMLSKLLPMPPEPGRPAGDAVCPTCVSRLNHLDGLTERAERQSRLIVSQYRAAHGQSAGGSAAGLQEDGDAVSEEMEADAVSEEQLSLLSQLDSMLHRLSPERFTEVASGSLSASPTPSPPPPDDGTRGRRRRSPYDPDSVLEVDADDPEPLESNDSDSDEHVEDGAVGDGRLADDDDVMTVGVTKKVKQEEEEEEEEEGKFGVEALMAETIYSAPGSPSADVSRCPGRPGLVRTIYVQLMAGRAPAEDGGVTEETVRRSAGAASAAGGGSTVPPSGASAAAVATSGVAANAAGRDSSVTKVAETVKVVCLGPTDRLVPRPLPYRKRSDRAAAADEPPPPPPPPPVKRGRGRPRKTNPAVVRRCSVLHRKLQYVTAQSLVDQKVETVELAAELTPIKCEDTGQAQGIASPGVAKTVNGGTSAMEPKEPTGEETSKVELPSDADPDEDWDGDGDAEESGGDGDRLGPPTESAQTTHRRRLAEAMERVNSRIAKEKLQSGQAGSGEDQRAAAAATRLLPRPNTSEEWSISARSRRVNGLYTCEVCQNSYTMLRDLLKHEKTHTEAKFPCPMCNKSFTLPKLVRKHQKFHKMTTAYQCDQCGLRCRSQMVLLEHMHQHTGGKHFSCGVCHLSFSSRQRFRAHERVHTGRRTVHECGDCGRRFGGDRAGLQRHRQGHTEPRLPCPQPGCERRFDTEKRLTHHLLQHVAGPPWRCTICDKEFKTKYSLRDHTRAHSGQKPFGCELCAARFSLRSNLIMHVRYVHQNDRRYECELCGKRFKRRRLLTYHMMAHAGNRPLSCPHCPLQMIYPEHLKQHMRTHSGEKPYRCDVCNKAFSRSDNLKAHMFTHSNKKPFECRQCGMGFMRKMSLLQHMEHLGHGDHPDDYVINRTLVTSELAAPDEQVHTVQLMDDQDGNLVMVVKGDGRREMLVPDGHFVTGDGQQLSGADAPFLGSEVQYVTADGQTLDLIIDETDAGAGQVGGGGGGGGSGGGDSPAVDLVIEEGGREGPAGAVDLILQDEQGQLVLQREGQDGQLVFQSGPGQGGQLVLQAAGGAAETDQWVLHDADGGRQIVLQRDGRQLQLGDGGRLV